jgi:GH15 family glucan-1,4-alpha-glucosidase
MAGMIEDYGLIGNLHTAALVSAEGSVDWFCAPRFDSDACFAALVGYDEHGRWSLRPTVPARDRRRRYRDDTLTLESEVICEGGAVRLIDAMPLSADRCDIVRVIEGLDGEVPMEMILDARFAYGANSPWIYPVDGGFSLVAGPDAMLLRGPVTMNRMRDSVVANFSIKKGQRIAFQLNWHPSHLPDPREVDVERELARTEQYWRDWAGRCQYQGKWRDPVLRSLITLKALTYLPTGAIVAAPTTSLPEQLGGPRNWDYRFCWLRDSSLTIIALMMGGYVDEATAFRNWLLRAAAGAPEQTQIMYNLDGARRLTEFDLDWLPGYEGSRPVRVGNAASDQLQLDVYGEVLNSLFIARRLGIPPEPRALTALRELIEHVGRIWQEPDDGIWEVRGGRRHFTYSKVMAWVAVDRAIRYVEEFGQDMQPERDLLPHWRALRERIHEEVCKRGFHPGLQAFTQHYGSETLDASVLLIPHMGFLPATDPRMMSTVRAVERGLLRDGFVLRYATEHAIDGLPGDEGAFLACSFWLVDNYALSGRTQDAEALFERLLSLRNPLGLLAEEYDPARRRQVGNFPQGFSHLALISSAYMLSRKAPEERARFSLAQHETPAAP